MQQGMDVPPEDPEIQVGICPLWKNAAAGMNGEWVGEQCRYGRTQDRHGGAFARQRATFEDLHRAICYQAPAQRTRAPIVNAATKALVVISLLLAASYETWFAAQVLPIFTLLAGSAFTLGMLAGRKAPGWTTGFALAAAYLV